MIDWQETLRLIIINHIRENPNPSMQFKNLFDTINRERVKNSTDPITLEVMIEQVRILVLEGQIAFQIVMEGFGEKTYDFRVFLPRRILVLNRDLRPFIAENYPAFAEFRYVMEHSPESIMA